MITVNTTRVKMSEEDLKDEIDSIILKIIQTQESFSGIIGPYELIEKISEAYRDMLL